MEEILHSVQLLADTLPSARNIFTGQEYTIHKTTRKYCKKGKMDSQLNKLSLYIYKDPKVTWLALLQWVDFLKCLCILVFLPRVSQTVIRQRGSYRYILIYLFNQLIRGGKTKTLRCVILGNGVLGHRHVIVNKTSSTTFKFNHLMN